VTNSTFAHDGAQGPSGAGGAIYGGGGSLALAFDTVARNAAATGAGLATPSSTGTLSRAASST
jgi:hypothetical protein